MKFFMPATDSSDQAEKAYQAVKQFMETNIGPVLPTRYYAIYYEHNGTECRARVGEPDPVTGEIVVAMFRTERESGPFLIRTPNRGVIRGDAVLANGNARAVHFELD